MNQPLEEPPDADAVGGLSSLPHPLKQKLKDGIVALSLATLCFISAWFRSLFDADQSYFNKLPVNRVTLLAYMVNILWFAVIIWLILRAMHRCRNRTFRFIVHVLFLLLLLVPLDFVRVTIYHIADYKVIAFAKQPLGFAFILALAAFVLWQHELLARTAAIIVGILSPLAFFTLCKIILLYLGVIYLGQPSGDPEPAALLPVRDGSSRVVWIIFDETDQRLAFEQRPANLHMPEFDRLRSESLCATNAYPPGDATLISLPGLISGRRAASVSFTNSSDLIITLADTGEVTTWTKLPSVFSSARELGFNTALVGWYHPYSRVLPGVLNYCTWYPYPAFEPARAPTFGGTLIAQIGCIGWTFHNRQNFIALCNAAQKESLSVVTNASYGLVFLHLPPPHKPGVYLPDKRQFTSFGMPKTQGYFNNLALADLWLGELRHAMEVSGQWDKTWVILSSDHSWRESNLYDGKRDLRVPFLVKPPEGGKEIVFSHPMNTVLTHDLILAILRGEITGQQNAAAWLEKHLLDFDTKVSTHEGHE